MRLNNKWYDYLIAGGLFWLPQFFFLAIHNRYLISKSGDLKTLLLGFSDPVITLFTTAIIALVTLIILITGAILDLVVSGLPHWETGLFFRHLSLNQPWVEKALQKYSLYIQEDYANLKKVLSPTGIFIDIEDKNLFVTSMKTMLVVFGFDEERKKALLAFNRLYWLVVVRALSKSENEPPELLVGPLQTWWFARILSSVLLIIAPETVLVLIPLAPSILIVALMLVAGIAIFSFAIFITARGFDRVCIVLFSLWYDFETSEEEKKDQTGNVGHGDKVARKKVRKLRTTPGKKGERRT